jgi:hypothetical protein
MKKLDRWLGRLARSASRMVLLEDALLADRFRPYAVYRLRFFFLRYAVSSVVFGVKFILLFTLFANEFFELLRLQVIAGLIAHTWWGSLETMRGAVRDLHRSGRTFLVPREIARWLSFGVQLALVTILAVGTWAALRGTRGGFDAADLYVVAIFLRLAAGFVVRCYHSGAYALRRVYRPLSSMLAADVASFVGTLLLWPAVGRWSFPIATLASTAVTVTLSLIFTSRTYRFFGFFPHRAIDLRTRPPLRGRWREFALGGASYGLLRLDALLVLGLFRGQTSVFGDAVLFTLFFALGPTVRAGFEWAQLFYFDLKRLEVPLFADLKASFERHLLRLAWAMGLIFWVVAVLVTTVIFQRGLGILYVATLPFFVVRAFLAVHQIRRYAEGAYVRLLTSGVVAFAGFLLIGRLALSPVERIVWAAVVLGVATTIVAARSGGNLRARAWRTPLWAMEWLQGVSAVDQSVRVRSVQFWEGPRDNDLASRPWHQENRWRYAELADSLARRLRGRGAVAIFAPDRLTWFELADRGEPEMDVGWIVQRGGGHVVRVAETDWYPNGRTALSRAWQDGLLGPPPESDGERSAAAPADLRARFSSWFPTGLILRPTASEPAVRSDLASEERRAILADAMSFGRDLGPFKGRATFDVTALFEDGRLTEIFVVSSRERASKRLRWRAEVRASVIASAIGTVVERMPEPVPAR